MKRPRHPSSGLRFGITQNSEGRILFPFAVLYRCFSHKSSHFQSEPFICWPPCVSGIWTFSVPVTPYRSIAFVRCDAWQTNLLIKAIIGLTSAFSDNFTICMCRYILYNAQPSSNCTKLTRVFASRSLFAVMSQMQCKWKTKLKQLLVWRWTFHLLKWDGMSAHVIVSAKAFSAQWTEKFACEIS